MSKFSLTSCSSVCGLFFSGLLDKFKTFGIFFQVLRAQNLMAAEAAVTGPAGIPSTCPRPTPAGMALPQGLRQSLPIKDNTMNARQKIQAKIDSEGFFVPKQQDTKRFQPRQFVKVCFDFCAL